MAIKMDIQLNETGITVSDAYGVITYTSLEKGQYTQATLKWATSRQKAQDGHYLPTENIHVYSTGETPIEIKKQYMIRSSDAAFSDFGEANMLLENKSTLLQWYEYLMTLPEFASAMNVLEPGQPGYVP